MNYYRFYCLDSRGRIISAIEHHDADDDAALRHAVALRLGIAACPAMEVWCGARRVGLVDGRVPSKNSVDTEQRTD